MNITDPALVYTSPDNRGKCGFCGKGEQGYAKRDTDGKFRASCWFCVKPLVLLEPQKRKQVGSIQYEDLDTDDRLVAEELKKKKSPGLAPSSYRPEVR